jgi:glycosyltransferase involved in cell wall biosynthesis
MILHVLDPGEAGGRERVVQGLAAAQRRAGRDVAVVAVIEPGTEPAAFAAPLKSAGVEIVYLPVPRRRYLGERAQLARLLSQLRPAVVHTHGYRPDVVDAGVARQLGIPTVTTVHGFTGGDRRNRFYEWTQRRAFRRMDAVVAVSQPLADLLAAHGISRDRIDVVPNGWVELTEPLDRDAARAALGVENRDFHLGWVGRLSHEKGPDLFLQALVQLEDLPFRASIMGSGQESSSLRTRADALGLSDRVRWHGTIRDAVRFFPAFDVLVLTSRAEGTPVVLLEAMAVGVPIVATAVGGVPDLLTHSEAVLVPPGDPEALAAAARRVYGDRAGARARAEAARRRLVSCCDAATWVDRYDSVYSRIRSGPKRALGW